LDSFVRLADKDILTREVLDYEGLHLFHYATSSCSQKSRIVLNLKQLAWQPHYIDLSQAANNETWFLGINPRGLVPVLVNDGVVHIESNDILRELERIAPSPVLFPAQHEAEIADFLIEEDDLHIDLRTLSFRFVFNRTKSTKPAEALERYRNHGTGSADPKKKKEIAFYDRIGRDGITDQAVRVSAEKFRDAFARWNERLGGFPFLLGDTLTIIDIAWYVYAKRLRFGGYPVQRLHPNVEDWFQRLDGQSEFLDGIALTSELKAMIAANRRQQEETGTTFAEIVGW
tara:strand:+ start:958 stop:1818 length:861 start_codon:yes stop_codon:yes gene_type:complete